MIISKQLLAECVPDSLNWNNAIEAHYRHAPTKPLYAGSNERGMSFYASFKEVCGRILLTMTPALQTKEKGKVVTEQLFTNLCKSTWLT